MKWCIINRILKVQLRNQSESIFIDLLYKYKQADLRQSTEIQLGIICKHCYSQEFLNGKHLG